MSILRTVLYSILLVQTCYSSQPEVSLQQGIVRGLYTTTVTGRRFSSFLGIPYAKPPVGKHRFKEPVPANPWLGVYNATRASPKCLQLDHLRMNTPLAVHGSEDCLYINVFTPMLPKEDEATKLLDVIAYIHGGAFMFSHSTAMGPSILLDRDVVLVTFNYRLGPLGFLSTGDYAAPGNNGLKDQVLALKWIQQNVAAFGGNPDSVTLAGLSAGGASVHYHVLSSLSKGLFKAAISASGVSLNPWPLAENSREKAHFVAKDLGCPTKDSLSLVKCLRDRPAEHIVGTTRHFLPWLYNPFSPYAPVVEPPGPNAFLPDYPINILKQGIASDVPILFTFTKEEGLYPGADLDEADSPWSSWSGSTSLTAPGAVGLDRERCIGIDRAHSSTKIGLDLERCIDKDLQHVTVPYRFSPRLRSTFQIHQYRHIPKIISSPKNLKVLKNRWNELLPHLLDYNFTVPSDTTKDEVSQKIKQHYNIDLDTEEGAANLIKAMSDRLFVQGIAKSAKLHASLYSSPVYLYRFSYSGRNTFSILFGGGKHLGVSHGDDIIYILLFHHMNPHDDEADKQVSKQMLDLWTLFAANGTLEGQTVSKNLPKVAFTDIQGPNQIVPTLVDELGKEKFWESLNLKENIETFHPVHNEL